MVEFNKTRDTVLIYMRNMDFDSVRVAFLQNNKPVDTISLRKGRKESFERVMTLQYSTTADNKLKPSTDLVITSSTPIQSIDNSILTFTEDSTVVSNYTLTKDTATLKKLTLSYKFKPESRYQLVFNDGTLTSIYGDKNKRTQTGMIKQFQVDKASNYGELTLKVTVPDTSKGYVVELLNDQKNVVRRDAITKSMLVTYKNYPVGKYRVRVVYDDNKNGKWDTGNYKKGIQPESIWLYTKDITLRSNWEAEEPIDIPKEPTTY
jgi:hypothetical protein